MSRSNTANGGTTYADLAIQQVSADAGQYTLRAVVYLTSRSVGDSTNEFSVTGNWSRSGAYALSGVYGQPENGSRPIGDPVWSQDLSFARQASAYNVSFSMAWSSVNYWGVTLSASESFTVPAAPGNTGPPVAPIVTIDNVTATSIHTWMGQLGADNGSPQTNWRWDLYRVSDSALLGTQYGNYTTGVNWGGLAPYTLYGVFGLAENQYGWSGYGPRTDVRTFGVAPAQPAAPTFDQVTSSSVRMHWSPPANTGGAPITRYLVRLSTANDTNNAAAIVYSAFHDVSVTATTITGLLPATQYYGWFWAENAYAAGATSPTAGVKTLSSVLVKVTGTWVQGVAWVNVAGAWTRASTVWKKVNGTWVK